MPYKRWDWGHWLALLERYGVEFVVLTRQTDGDLVTSLRRDSDWVVRHEAEGAVFFFAPAAARAAGPCLTSGGMNIEYVRRLGHRCAADE